MVISWRVALKQLRGECYGNQSSVHALGKAFNRGNSGSCKISHQMVWKYTLRLLLASQDGSDTAVGTGMLTVTLRMVSRTVWLW